MESGLQGERITVRLVGIALVGASLVAGTAPVVAQERSAFGAFDCVIEPRLRVKLATPVSGILKEVRVDRGSRVAKGEVVATLESAIEETSLAIAEARSANDATVEGRRSRMAYLARKRDRLAQLLGKGAATQATVEEVESDLRLAEQDFREAEFALRLAQLEAARAAEILRQRSITSPFDGVVVERNLWRGEYAYEQAPILTIAQVDPLNVEVFLPIAVFDRIRLGSEADVRPDQPVGGVRRARVDVIDTIFDSRSGSFGVRLVLPNPGNLMPAGLRCKVEFPDLRTGAGR